MFRTQDKKKVLALLEGATAAGRTTLAAIDGLGGAGKSTLAAQIAEEIERSAVVSVDDFYRPMAASARAELGPKDGDDQYFHWQRLRDDVLVPLSRRYPQKVCKQSGGVPSL